MPPTPIHPCLSCGACCISFLVDFATQERSDHGGMVPAGLALDVLPGISRMRGTDHRSPRCAALVGTPGVAASCGIYEWRPSPCRDFEAGSDACERARMRRGLAPYPSEPMPR